MKDVYEKGYLSDFSNKILIGVGYDKKEKLTTPQMEAIARIYGKIARHNDLYEVLFESGNKTISVDSKIVHIKDLALFTLMAWQKRRGYYWQPTGKSQTEDTIVCAGVPLAFLGARREFNKSYMSWYDENNPIRCDIFLPKGLSSYELNDAGDFVRSKEQGLILLHARHKLNGFRYEAEDVRYLRSTAKNYATQWRPRRTLKSTKVDDLLVEHYNQSHSFIRCMLLQGWCWYPPTRNDDMITDFRDWDNFFPAVMPEDAPSLESPPSIQRFFKHKPKLVEREKNHTEDNLNL